MSDEVPNIRCIHARSDPDRYFQNLFDFLAREQDMERCGPRVEQVIVCCETFLFQEPPPKGKEPGLESG